MRLSTLLSVAVFGIVGALIGTGGFFLNAAIYKDDPELMRMYEKLESREAFKAQPPIDWEVIDRTHKGDRLALTPRQSHKAERFHYNGPRCSWLSNCPRSAVI